MPEIEQVLPSHNSFKNGARMRFENLFKDGSPLAKIDPQILREMGLLPDSPVANRAKCTRDEWIRALEFERHHTPARTLRRAENLRSQIDILTFSEFGIAEADCHVGKNSFSVEFNADFEGKTCSTWCSCSQHSKNDCCVHTSLLVQYLTKQLSNPKSELSTSLETEEESQTQLVLEELDRFLDHATVPDPAGFPEERQTDVQRLIWRLTVGHEATLEPFLQAPKKTRRRLDQGQEDNSRQAQRASAPDEFCCRPGRHQLLHSGALLLPNTV